jgi:hypothetical protein
MNTLFPLEPILPPGFSYHPHFITEEEETLLLEKIQGTNWHRDAPPFDTIAGISLLSNCLFRLKPHDKAHQSRKAVLSLPVQRRSLYIMAGASRTDWQHSIAPVSQTRYSITLRTLNTTNLLKQ